MLPNAIIHCSTIEEAKSLIAETHSENRYLECWKNRHQEATCFCLERGQITGFCYKSYYESKGYQVLSFMDYAKANNFNVLHSFCTLSQEDRSELFGCLIDVVEDFLTEKGLTPDEIPNDTREEDSEALICGSDYDDLVNRFAEVLDISRYTEEESQDQIAPSLSR